MLRTGVWHADCHGLGATLALMKSNRLLFASGIALLLIGACGIDARERVSLEPGAGSAPSLGGQAAQPEEPGVPFFGIPLPATLEAEAFARADERGPGQEGSEDCASPVNPDVDIEASDEASGGCAVGYALAGEWLEFDVAVGETGAFDFVLTMASELTDRSVSISIDGVYRGRLEVSASGWFDFADYRLEGVGLTRGSHVLRITFDTSGVNLDKIEIADAGACVPACEGRSCGQDFCGGECGACASDQLCSTASQCVGPFKKAVLEHGALEVQGGQIIDESGEPAQLRGVSTQWLNWEQSYSTSPSTMQYMRDSWGLEVFRIANGVEHGNGYLLDPEGRMKLVRQIIETAISLDVYVIVDFHTHEEEHLEVAQEFFAEIAKDYGDKPHVIYEPFNEPIGPSNGEADYWRDVLKPYHEAVVQTIREHDPDNLIILGTPRWSQAVDVAAADPLTGDNLAYTLHFYSCTHGGWLRDRAQTALDAGAALFVTEWATTHADGGTSDNPGTCLGASDTWHSWLDERKIGSAAWKLNTDGDSSAILLSGASPQGGWSDENLSEHGLYVRSLLQRD